MAELRDLRSLDLLETIFTLFAVARTVSPHLKRLKRSTLKGLGNPRFLRRFN